MWTGALLHHWFDPPAIELAADRQVEREGGQHVEVDHFNAVATAVKCERVGNWDHHPG